MGIKQSFFNDFTTDYIKYKYHTNNIFPLDLRVGQIVNIQDQHEHFYILHVDLQNETRQILAAIRESYPDPKLLLNKKVVVLCNMEKTIRYGVETEGMVLALKSNNKHLLFTTDDTISNGVNIVPNNFNSHSTLPLTIDAIDVVLKWFKSGPNNTILYENNQLPIVKSDTI